MKQLSGLTDIAVIQSDQGYTITTSDGSPLVVAGQSYSLQTSPDAVGMQHIYAQGRDVTATMQGGQIGGLNYSARSGHPRTGHRFPEDDLAGGLATNFNTAHQAGFDLAGNAGQNFFSNVTGAGAATNFSVQITDPSLIAASSDGLAGSNGNLTVLQAVQNQTLPTGPKPMDLYSQLVFTVGNATAQAKARLDASDVSLQQLNDQRGAISGVSIDEETTNLIRFQHAYQASARVISVVDELTLSNRDEHVEPVGRKLCAVNPDPTPDILSAIWQTQSQAQTAMEQLSTGKRVNRPSDDPAASATEVQNQAQEDRIHQYLQSVSSLRSQFQTADSTLSSMVTSLNWSCNSRRRSRQQLTLPQNWQSIGQEALGVLDQLVQLANTTFHGSYIFAGTDTVRSRHLPRRVVPLPTRATMA